MRPPGIISACAAERSQGEGEPSCISEFGRTERSGITFEGHPINLFPSLHEIVFAGHVLSRRAQLGWKSLAITCFIMPLRL